MLVPLIHEIMPEACLFHMSYKRPCMTRHLLELPKIELFSRLAKCVSSDSQDVALIDDMPFVPKLQFSSCSSIIRTLVSTKVISAVFRNHNREFSAVG